MKTNSYPHILIFEPRAKGHHLSWLRYITEDFLEAGFTVSLAVDCREKSALLIQTELASVIANVNMLPVFTETGKWRGQTRTRTIARCLKESGAAEVLMPNLDEIASNCFRFAAFGIFPSQILKSRLNGIYHRPRFLAYPDQSVDTRIKSIGFKRLCRHRWFKHIYLLDEYLFTDMKSRYPETSFCFIPDPAETENFFHSQSEARNALNIPQDKVVFLNYGVGARRKGLHVAVQAMFDAPDDRGLFLLCAGHIVKDAVMMKGLRQLEQRGCAKVMDRYVSDAEEKLCFCASDAVLLPYIHHFGSSGVLSRAAAAGRMVIASDEELIARRVREHCLGWLFPTENSNALGECMYKVACLTDAEKKQFQDFAVRYACLCSRQAFKMALLSPYSYP